VDSKRTAIIDGDIVVYRAGFASQDYIHKVLDQEGNVLDEFSSKAEANDFSELVAMSEEIKPIIETEIIPKSHDDVDMIVDVMIKNVIVGAEATDYIIYLSGKTNFRNTAATIREYKGNRSNSERPVHYDYIREYIADKHPTVESENCEADDLCAMRLFSEYKKAEDTKRKSDCQAILCSIDKDLMNIPGYHYNIKDKKIEWVTKSIANKHFAKQLLTGDNVDNIPGISYFSDKKKKIGPKTAEKLLEDCNNLKELSDAVKSIYKEFAGENWEDKLQEVGTLLWMQRHPEQKFDYLTWEQGLYE